MVQIHRLSPIYNESKTIGSTLGNIAPQKEIKNLINQIDFDENVLHQYQNWTYHIQWYMIPYNTYIAREYMMLHTMSEVTPIYDGKDKNQRIYGVQDSDFYRIDPSEKVIIFETGVTSQYAFDSLNYKTVYSENDLNGFIHMTNMNLKIKELDGCSFKDKLVCVSRALGWDVYSNGNAINMPHFLEISFIGYDNNTGMPVKIGNHPYMFKMAMTGIDAQVNTSGATYNIKFVPNNQYGFSKDNFIAENLGTIANEINGGTFRSVIESLERSLNKKFFEIADNEILQKYYPMDDVVDVDMTEIGRNERDKSSYSNVLRGSEAKSFAKTNPNMTPIPTVTSNQTSIGNTSVGKRYIFVIDENIADTPIFSKSTYYTQTGETNNQLPNPNKTLNSIVKDIWNNIIPTGRENIDVRIFTKQIIVGKRPNDEGLVERIYYFIVPYIVPFKEYYYNKYYNEQLAENYQKKKTNQPIRSLAEHINLLQRSGLLSRRYEYMFSGRDVNVLNFDFKIDGLWYMKPPTELGKVIDYNRFDIPADSLETETNTLLNVEEWIQKGISNEAIRQTASQIFNALYKKYTKSGNVDNSPKYLDDINSIISDNDKIMYLNYGKIPIRADNTSPREDRPSEEKEYSPIIRRTALEEMHSAGKMCKITFEILGDPFWLGDETFDNSLCRIKKCVYGNHHIIFAVKTPANRDNITGEQQLDTSTTISGFYIVTQVEHNFNSSGKFTQKITAVIDPMSTVRSDYEDASLDSIDGTVFENMGLTTTSNYIPKPDITQREVTAMGQTLRPVANVKDTLQKCNWNKLADIGQSTVAGQATSINQTLIG